MKKRKIAGALLALALLAGLCITGCGSSAGDDKGDVRTGTNAEVQTDEATTADGTAFAPDLSVGGGSLNEKLNSDAVQSALGNENGSETAESQDTSVQNGDAVPAENSNCLLYTSRCV